MNYIEARNYISNIEGLGTSLGLSRIKELLRRLDNPQDKCRVIHVAGTNGKGSICACLDAIYREAGLKVGRYISPTLFTYLERFQINGKNMDNEMFADILGNVKNCIDDMLSDGLEQPTVFEIETAVAFQYFYQENCDLVILETGMGGALDSTNVVEKPIATVFASISMDHMEFLGDTIEKIALEKAGIMRDGVPVVIAPMDKTAETVLVNEATKHKSKIVNVNELLDQEVENATLDSHLIKGEDGKIYREISWLNKDTSGCLGLTDSDKIITNLLGDYQADNVVTAYETVKLLGESVLRVDEKTVDLALMKVKWPGRFEILQDNPAVIRDGAHNPDAVLRLKSSILEYQSLHGGDIYLVMGVFKDKAYREMIDIMAPLAKKVFTVTPLNAKRALDSAELREAFIEAGCVNLNENDIIDVAGISATKPDSGVLSSTFASEEAEDCNSYENPSHCMSSCYESFDDMDIIEKGINLAKKAAGKGDIILCFGSLSLAKSVRPY